MSEAMREDATGHPIWQKEVPGVVHQAKVVVTFQVPVTVTFGRNLHEIKAAVAAWPLTPEGR